MKSGDLQLSGAEEKTHLLQKYLDNHPVVAYTIK